MDKNGYTNMKINARLFPKDQGICSIKYSLQVSISEYLANKKRYIHIINYTKNQIINN